MDFAGYSALSGRKDWASIRSDRLMEMSLLKQQQQDLDIKISQQAQAQSSLDDYMSNLKQVSVLEQDQQKLNAVEQAARKTIVEGIKKSGNDVRKFILSGGGAILKDYTMNVLTSKEMTNAMNNKLAWGQYVLNKANGLQDRPMEEGTIEDQLAKLTSGDIDRIKYNGAAKPVPFNTSLITSMYGKNPNKRQAASREDIYKAGLSQGMEDFQAKKYADDYSTLVDNGSTPLYYNYKTDNGSATMTKALKRISDNIHGGNEDLFTQYLKGNFSNKDNSKTFNWTPNNRNIIGRAKDLGKAASEAAGSDVSVDYTGLDKEMMSKLTSMSGLRWDKNANAYYLLGSGVIESTGEEIDLTEDDITIGSILDYATVTDELNNIKSYLRVKLDKKNILIPINTNNFEVATHRHNGVQESRAYELQNSDMNELMLMQQALDEK